MYAIRSYYGRQLTCQQLDIQVAAIKIRRNLRRRFPQGNPGAQQQHGNQGDTPKDRVLARITSYNVCYTKLLRDLITDRHLGLRGLGRHVYGAYVLDTQTDHVVTVAASFTVLATGGAGKAFLYTTNPDTATGDGIAMAWRAGCQVANP